MMSYSPSQARDDRGRWSGGGDASSRSPVTAHAGIKSVHGKPHVGTYALGEGFTVNARTGKPITKGFAVAGGDKKSKALGGGGGWKTENVNIASGELLGKSLGRMRGQIAIYDLAKQKELLTGGKFDPAAKKRRVA